MKKQITSLILALTLIFCCALSGCDNIIPLSVETPPDTLPHTLPQDVRYVGYNDFSVNLLKECIKTEGNTLVSPLSVCLALAMAAEGADTETLKEIEDTLGLDICELRAFAYAFLEADSDNSLLNIANSLWVNDADGFTADEDFLKNNQSYYHADVFKAPFNDNTVKEINAWVKEKTDEEIEKIMESIDSQSVMCLVNALLFDAEWETVYNEHQVKEGTFTTENNVSQPATFLYSSEYFYIEDDFATGFIKPYKGGRYAFVALLPSEGISVKEYAGSLDGLKITNLLENIQETTVHAMLPKFEYAIDSNLKPILSDMVMSHAFDKEQADFSKLGKINNGNIWIGDVVHSTIISVTENGTKAGAATAIVFNATGAPQNPKEVYLNRPFLYMIVDTEMQTPIFIGSLTNL